MVPKRILIVDDHDLIREGIRTILSFADNVTVVGEASTGTKAVAMVEELEPDVVLMDVTMPEMDGLAATRLIKERWPAVQVIMVSMSEDSTSVLEAVRSGASGYLAKSSTLDEIQRAIASASNGGGVYLSPSIASRVIDAIAISGRSGSSDVEHGGLTSRERDVLGLLAQGMTARSIGHRLGITERTVDTHISNLYRRLGVNNRVDAVTQAMREGLVALPA